MSTNLEMMDLYNAIVEDCKKLLENNVDKAMKEKLEKIEPEIANYIKLYTEIFKLSKKTNISFYGIKYLENMSNYVYALKEGIKLENSLEHEIYSAYGFMWSFEYLYDLAKIEDICEFKLDKYKNFSSIIKDHGFSLKIKKNYEKNAKEIIGNKITEDSINKFLNLAIQNKLNQIKRKKKKKSKKDAKDKKQTNLSNGNLTSTSTIQKIDLMEKEPQKFENDNKIYISSQSQILEINEQKEEEKNDDLKNPGVQDEFPDNSQIKEINIHCEEEKETKFNFELGQTIGDSHYNQINIQSQTTEEAKDNLERPENNNDISQENQKQNIIQKDDEIKVIEENVEDNNSKEDIINISNKEYDKMDNSLSKDENVNAVNNKIISKNISYDELVSIVESLQNDLDSTKVKLVQHEERIQNLENNQRLLYYQLSMYQSRDISKSIYYYFCQHLGNENSSKAFFDLQRVMTDLLYGFNISYNEEQRKKLRKFFKTLFFVNKVNNRILHNNLSTNVKNAINEKKKDDLLSLIPPLGYDQIFQTLGNFIENNSKNPQLQEAMKFVYDTDYSRDDKLENIRDGEGERAEAIVRDENSVKMLISINEINEVKAMFSTIKIKDIEFSKLCDTKTWDE